VQFLVSSVIERNSNRLRK